MMRPSKPPEDPHDQAVIEQRAVFLLGRREQSAAELSRKLRDKGFAADAVDEVLARLQERGWQSDQRFAESMIRQRLESAYGPLKIYADMQQKGIDRSLVDDILAQSEVDWQALAVSRYQRRFGTEPPADEKEKARRQRHLAARGFYPGDVFAACKIAVQGDDC
ncbi:MAG: regulatory protein RecX [Idiomarina sp.]|nr:regulatory protein RecX [Idiomarina sp.]